MHVCVENELYDGQLTAKTPSNEHLRSAYGLIWDIFFRIFWWLLQVYILHWDCHKLSSIFEEQHLFHFETQNFVTNKIQKRIFKYLTNLNNLLILTHFFLFISSKLHLSKFQNIIIFKALQKIIKKKWKKKKKIKKNLKKI